MSYGGYGNGNDVEMGQYGGPMDYQTQFLPYVSALEQRMKPWIPQEGGYYAQSDVGDMPSDELRNIKEEFANLKSDTTRTTNEYDFNNKKNHVKRLGAQLQKIHAKQLEKTQQAERDAYNNFERQYRIPYPNAEEDEIRARFNDPQQRENVFAQAVMRSGRTQGAESALQHSNARYNEMAQIERQLLELATMFQNLDAMVIEQDYAINNVEQSAVQVNEDLNKGNDHVNAGIKSARLARKWKWWCLFICILIILIAVLAGYFGYKAANPGK